MKLQHQAKRIFTAALIVWMSGIVLFLCCDMSTAHASSSEGIESCPLAKKGNCAKTAATEADYSFKYEPQTFDCCTFPAKIFDKARKLEKAPQSTIASNEAVDFAPLYFSLKNFSGAAKFYQSFVFNRESTYLRNRVFRI